jgi:hypothetical protein
LRDERVFAAAAAAAAATATAARCVVHAYRCTCWRAGSTHCA